MFICPVSVSVRVPFACSALLVYVTSLVARRCTQVCVSLKESLSLGMFYALVHLRCVLKLVRQDNRLFVCLVLVVGSTH